MQRKTTPQPLPDLDACENEPIRSPGSIQAGGLLLVLTPDTLTITQVSANCPEILNRSTADLLDRPLTATLGDALAAGLIEALDCRHRPPAFPARFHWRPAGLDAEFACRAHTADGRVLLELEPQIPGPGQLDADALQHALDDFAAVDAAPHLEAKLAEAAVRLRRITGYDRVMIYRFEPDWHGQVIAEDRRPDLPTYLGLYYPASDIPASARSLYCVSPIRVIADIDAPAVPIEPPLDPQTGAPLDLSRCHFRSVSPVHLEYLRNMGVRATLTASLLRDGQLWGLVACHHLTPRPVASPLRTLVASLTRHLATQIALAEEKRVRERGALLKTCRSRIVEAMRAGTRLPGLLKPPYVDDVLSAVGGDGVALLHGGAVQAAGRTPDHAAIARIHAELRDRFRDRDGELFATDCLSRDIPWTQALAADAAGVVVQPLGDDPSIKLLWFRGELPRQVTWGGDPHKTVEIDDEGRINPRKSFAAWREIVRLHSAPWDAEALESAKELATLIDIELRKIAEEALRDREMQLRNLLDNSPAAISMMDLQGRYRHVNRRFETLFGARNADIVGKTPKDVLGPERGAGIMERDREVIASLEHRASEEVIPVGGVERTLLSTRFAVFDGTGRPHSICRIAVDITERRNAERGLEIALAKYRTLFEHFPLGIAVVDAEGLILETSQALQHMLRLRPGDDLHRAIADLCRDADPADGTRSPSETLPLQQALADRQVLRDQELAVRGADGARRWLSVTLAPLSLQGFGAVALFEDITARKEAQAEREARAALIESERRFRAITEGLPLTVWIHDEHHRATFVNATAAEFAGRAREELTGEGWISIVHEDDREQIARALLEGCRERKRFRTLCRARRADGDWRWLESFARPFYQPDGSFAGTVGVSIDITERKHAHEALRESHRELAHRARELGELTSQLTMAEQRERERLAKTLHDHLQQILVGVSLSIQRVRRRAKDLPPPQWTEAALDDAEKLLRQALDTTRVLVADLSPPILHDAGLPPALEWLARLMKQRYNLDVALHLDPEADPRRPDLRGLLFDSVREALFNVVKHARTEAAEVALSRPAPDRLRIVVTDHGTGCDLGIVTGSISHRAGFGLISMRERLRHLGGSWDIESSPGRGMRIAIEAPLSAADTVDAGVPAPGAPVRILVVDDHAMIRRGIAMLIDDELDLQIVGEAADGFEAVAMAADLQPDVILMDCSMPGLDGIEATRRIVAIQPGAAVIGVSMYADADRAEAMIAAGAVGYVAKSAVSDELLQAIRKAMPAAAGA